MFDQILRTQTRQLPQKIERVAQSTLALWVASGVAVAAAENSQTLEASSVTITKAAQILGMSSEQARTNPPVQIRGMVTYYEQDMALFVQDETAGIFVYHTGGRLDLKPGQFVEVSGIANRGRYSPIIDSPRIRRVEPGATVGPRRVSLAEVFLGALDAQWVEFTAVVRSQHFIGHLLQLELCVPPHRVKAWITHYDEQHPPELVGDLVNVKGVVGTFSTDQGELQGFQLFVNEVADLTIVQPAPQNPFSVPIFSVHELNSQTARVGGPGRVRTRGIITLSSPGRAFLQDVSGGLELVPDGSVGDLMPGDSVEAAGFLGPALEGPRLEDAVVRKLGSGSPPRPVKLLREDLFQGHHNHELVELEATLLGRFETSSNGTSLTLQGDGRLVTALTAWQGGKLPGALEPGCRVRIIGVSEFTPVTRVEPMLSVILRSPTDIELLASPTWSQKVGSAYLVAMTILVVAGIGLALRYFQKQRRQTEHVLHLQASLQAEMNQSHQQLRRSIDERERIARDLHDDIIQSIYAVGLTLEDCRRLLHSSPEAESRLVSAINLLNSTIRSARGFIAGLEPKVLNGREFRTALKSLALTSGDGHEHFHIEVDPTAANRLNAIQATQLLHISKEAMSNSLRHAQASSVSVSLYPVNSGVCLEIVDNGAGFQPDLVKGAGHGLRNMTARAREIAADLQIVSAPGQGCRILVNVPAGNTNEPN